MAQERSEPKRESPAELAKKKTEADAKKKKASAGKPADGSSGASKKTTKKAEKKKASAGKPADGSSGGAKKKAAAKPKAEPKVPAKPKSEEKPKRRAPRRRGAAAKEEVAKPKAPTTRPVVNAHAKYVRSSARKARLVIDHIRGKSVEDARALLKLSPRAVAEDLEKLLNSAVANAENNHELVGDDLFVKEITADEGPTLRRFRPRAQGRATRIRKRTSHLSISLSTKD